MGLFDVLFGNGMSSDDEASSASNRARRQWNPNRRPIYDWEEKDENGVPLSMKRSAKVMNEDSGKKKIEEDTKKKGFLIDPIRDRGAKERRRSFWEKALGQ